MAPISRYWYWSRTTKTTTTTTTMLMLLSLLVSFFPHMGLGFSTSIRVPVPYSGRRNICTSASIQNNASSSLVSIKRSITTTVPSSSLSLVAGRNSVVCSSSFFKSPSHNTSVSSFQFVIGRLSRGGGSLHASSDDNNNNGSSSNNQTNAPASGADETKKDSIPVSSSTSLADFPLVGGLKEQQGEEYAYAQNLNSRQQNDNEAPSPRPPPSSTRQLSQEEPMASPKFDAIAVVDQSQQPVASAAVIDGTSSSSSTTTPAEGKSEPVGHVVDGSPRLQQNDNEELQLQLQQQQSFTPNNKLFSWTSLDKKILAVALPCIANFAINPLIGAVDLFWVGRMGDALAVAGQSAANQVFNSAFWMVSFLPSVTATLVSKVYAADDPNAVQDTVCQSLLLATMIALPFTLLLLLKPNFFLRSVLQPDAPAMAYAKPYFLIRAIGFLPSLLSVTGYSAFRGALDTVTPLRISLFANVFNAMLDPICMFTLGMGIEGAAAATLASELISVTLYMIWMKKRNMISLQKLFKLPSMSILKPLLKGGAALQLRNMAINITFLMVTRATQAIDSSRGIAAAAHSLALQVFQVGGIVLLALSTVAQTLIPSELVVKRSKETGEYVSGGVYAARRTMSRLMEWGLVLGSVLGGLQILLLPAIQKVSPLKEVQQAALVPSYIASVLQIINGLVFIGEGAMVGCQNFFQLSLSTMVATMATTCALGIFPMKFGLTGVWMSFIVFNVLRLMGVYIHQTRTGPLAARNIHNHHTTTQQQ